MRGFLIFFLIYVSLSANSSEAQLFKHNDKKKEETYVEAVLKINPNDAKMLKLKSDIAISNKDFREAASALEKANDINKKDETEQNNTDILKNEKTLAFCYFQLCDYEKAMQIVCDSLQRNPNDLDLLNLAIKYALMQKKWDLAMAYLCRALALNPNSGLLWKIHGDLCATNKDFINAKASYERLIQICPREEYINVLENMNHADTDGEAAEEIITPIYGATPTDTGVVTTYTSALFSEEKSQEAYVILRKHSVDRTNEDLNLSEDIVALGKDFEQSNCLSGGVLAFEEENEYIALKYAETLRLQKNFEEAEKIYNELLAKCPDNLDAKLSLGYLELDRRNIVKSREYFQSVLDQKPDLKEAKMGLAYTYIANNENFSALRILNQIPRDDEVEYLKAKVYYYMEMYSDARDALRGVTSQSAEALRYKIRHIRANTVTPSYTILNQQLADAYDLDMNKVGINMSQYVGRNMLVFTEYNMYVYTSGNFNDNHLNNVTNEIRGGFEGRPTEKIAVRSDIGLKVFEYEGAMINTDSWIRYFVNDSLRLKAGFRRNNVIQSYLSAVGFPIDGVFMGRAAENKAYIEVDKKYPKKYYSFARIGGGAVTEQNLPTNSFIDGMIGFGRVIYTNPDNKWIQIITADVASYNSSYQSNVLNIRAKSGDIFGNYFSPAFYTANTVNVKFAGQVSKWHLDYGLNTFVGGQFILGPDDATVVFGLLPYLSYNLNDHICVNLSYAFSDYSNIVRHLAFISVNIRGFTHGKKNIKKA